MRTFDWKPRFDEKSKEYPVRGLMRSVVRRRTKLWLVGPILDQGSEGACVGFGWTAEILAEPFWADISKLPVGFPKKPQDLAVYIYKEAKKIDEYPGEDYDGTSVLAGAKMMQKAGIVASYSWAFSVNDIIDGIVAKGPVVLGIPWYEGMYEAPNGILSVSGEQVGGHCILAVGFVKGSKTFNGEDSVILQNSWGPSWGKQGLAEIRVSDLEKLFAEGEACFPSRRNYRRKTNFWGNLFKKLFGISA